MTTKKQIAKIYGKREKAWEVLLQCDIEIDNLLRKLDKVSKK